MQRTITLFSVLIALTALSGCSKLWHPDKSKELQPIQVQSQIKVQPLWSKPEGAGTHKQYLTLTPVVKDGVVYTDDAKGRVTATSASNGATLWKVNTKKSLTSGPAANNYAVYVGAVDGTVLALDAKNGATLWQKDVGNEILAAPLALTNKVIVKTVDAQVVALNAKDGKEKWRYGESIPTLILRAGSTPQESNGLVAIGFSSGKLTVVTEQDGKIQWQRTIAVPEGVSTLEQMVDIDASPIIQDGIVYVATYQGNMAALHLKTGQVVWQRDISSYTGFALDSKRIYVSDAKGQVWAFDKTDGSTDWRQTRLKNREITGPAISGSHLVIGDAQGNLYWLDKKDGKLLTKVVADKKVGFTAPPVAANSAVYAYNNKGRLYAYTG